MAVSSKRLKLCNFKLNVLLNITQAINESPSQDHLLERYETILKEDLIIGTIQVFKKSGYEWEQILNAGQKNRDISIDVEKDLLGYDDITFVTSSPNPALGDVDIIIPVYYKDQPLAFVLIGDIDEDVEGISPTIKHLHFIQTLSNIIVVAIENIRLRDETIRQEAIRKELELASRMQNMLIPDSSNLPDNKFLSMKAFYSPHFEIGGDYYDFLVMNEEEIGFCIADVSGKGISAALLMSNFQANLRALFTDQISLADLIGILNNRVMINTKGEKFITLFLGRYNYKTRVLEYVNAGHNPPILYESENRNLSYLSKGCVGMGMLDEIPIIKRGVQEINQRTKLLMYTDGLVELMDENGMELGTKSLEKDLVNQNSIHDNINHIIKKNHILEGNSAVFDDITILGVDFFT